MSTSWPDLHIDILYLIFEKLIDNNIKDLSNCAGVCSSWRFVRNQLVNKLSPVILLTDQGAERIDPKHDAFVATQPNQGKYRLFNTRTRKTQEIMLPELCGRWFCSAWPGWLFTTNCTYPHEIILLNPLTRAHITLPRPWDWEGDEEEILDKVVPSSSPLDTNCIFLGICRNMIRFCRAGDKTWSTTTLDYRGETFSISNAIYHKGAFYIVGHACHSNRDYMYRIRIDETTLALTVKTLLPLPKLDGGYDVAHYPVELMGELLLITEYKCHDPTSTKRPPKEWQIATATATNTGGISMMAHKLGDDMTWSTRVTTLGGKHAIYVGRFHSMSMYVGDCNDVHQECRRPNCVYFVDEFNVGNDTNGVYDFETERFEELTFPRTNPLNWFGFQ